MRRKEREVTNINKILKIIAKEMCIRDRYFAVLLPVPSDELQSYDGDSVELLSLEVQHRILPVSSPVSYTHLDVYKRQPMDFQSFVLTHDYTGFLVQKLQKSSVFR